MNWDVSFQKTSRGWLLFLPLCPSTNARTMPVRFGSVCRDILTPSAREYIDVISNTLKLWTSRYKFNPVDTHQYFDFWFILPRTNCDSHNYFKILADCLEIGGVVENDKFILPRVNGISFDAKNPEAIIFIKSFQNVGNVI